MITVGSARYTPPDGTPFPEILSTKGNHTTVAWESMARNPAATPTGARILQEIQSVQPIH
jgi:hypothetical protein